MTHLSMWELSMEHCIVPTESDFAFHVTWQISTISTISLNRINLLAPELFFFLILAHPVNKMWIKQEPNALELWNKVHFEEKNP